MTSQTVALLGSILVMYEVMWYVALSTLSVISMMIFVLCELQFGLKAYVDGREANRGWLYLMLNGDLEAFTGVKYVTEVKGKTTVILRIFYMNI